MMPFRRARPISLLFLSFLVSLAFLFPFPLFFCNWRNKRDKGGASRSWYFRIKTNGVDYACKWDASARNTFVRKVYKTEFIYFYIFIFIFERYLYLWERRQICARSYKILIFVIVIIIRANKNLSAEFTYNLYILPRNPDKVFKIISRLLNLPSTFC